MRKTWPSPDMQEFYLISDAHNRDQDLRGAQSDFLCGKISDYFPDLSEDEE